MTTPNINLPTSPNGSTNISIAYNAAMQIIDALLPLVVQSQTDPAPGSLLAADVGKRWIVPTGATGAWTGQDDKIALCTAEGTPPLWVFIDPPPYIVAFVIDDDADYRFKSGSWVAV